MDERDDELMQAEAQLQGRKDAEEEPAVAASTTPPPAPVVAENPEGTWSWPGVTAKSSGGQWKWVPNGEVMKVTIVKEGDGYELKDLSPAWTVTFDGKRVAFGTKSGGSLGFSGDLAGDTIVGTMSAPPAPDAPWTATRVK